MFNIGQKVTFTNSNGCIYEGKTIVRQASKDETWGDEPRYFIAPTDTPWFPVAESELTAVSN